MSACGLSLDVLREVISGRLLSVEVSRGATSMAFGDIIGDLLLFRER